jgi:type I restriction enzyme S subunit
MIDFSQFVGGSANPYMPLKNFGHCHVIVPNPLLLAAFEACAGQLRRRIEANESDSHAISALRDTLLPKLISGEVRVENAERIAGKTL